MLIVYLSSMDIAAILHEIDAEIEKLQKVRAIVSELSAPVRIQKKRTKRAGSATGPPVSVVRKRARQRVYTTTGIQPDVIGQPATGVVAPQPRLVILPPRKVRTHRANLKAILPVTRALGGTLPGRPIFVPKASLISAPVPLAAFDPEAMEAAVRRSLLDGRQAIAFA